jgi:hypothetical protein
MHSDCTKLAVFLSITWTSAAARFPSAVGALQFPNAHYDAARRKRHDGVMGSLNCLESRQPAD